MYTGNEFQDCHGRSSLQQAGCFYQKIVDFHLRKKLTKCYILRIALCGAETWTLRKVDQKCLEISEMSVLEKDGEDQLD